PGVLPSTTWRSSKVNSHYFCSAAAAPGQAPAQDVGETKVRERGIYAAAAGSGRRHRYGQRAQLLRVDAHGFHPDDLTLRAAPACAFTIDIAHHLHGLIAAGAGPHKVQIGSLVVHDDAT